ncbi:hypothetical protein GUITHDRAFT_152173 [Guillardia theta CCMP2712]|uniref:Uncharacterized protein n=1 Tax=Guillardia theta (strain CCMP2712) TaxID=905079 RepID=L1JGD6_GUITC|nr:hypothetical protein GUITHDRAFT_152173 [Guillardia theta CCMP2712]EKX47160.1 hypothetical protein GUITHDRAFT_152173 [Guillardia theta CCMP2712]|eukprot:XP_005834140.1 hypothetical protein GUITHDRAFT_152173 [Guillardia theta CCMP2712]
MDSMGIYFPTCNGIEMVMDFMGQQIAEEVAEMNSMAAQQSVHPQLAPIPVHAGVEIAPGTQTVRASPSQALLCLHACIFGAVSATSQLNDTNSASDSLAEWQANFSKHSQEAASSMSPLSAYFLSRFMFPSREKSAILPENLEQGPSSTTIRHTTASSQL